MKKILTAILPILLLTTLKAQDASQPGVNLGFSGTLESVIPQPGFYFFNYYHHFRGKSTHDEFGQKVEETNLNLGVWLHQFTYISPMNLLDGKVGFSLLLPIVFAPNSVMLRGDDELLTKTSNPKTLGDFTFGTAIQWFDKKLLGFDFAHRFELNAVFPTGSYDDQFDINPGSGFFSFQPSYGFTFFLNDLLSVSQRHHLTFSAKEPNSGLRAGELYHGIYSLEYQVFTDFWLAVHGYYLNQIANDFQGEVNLGSDSKEELAAIGPAINWVIKPGIMVGAKYLSEFYAKNRMKGSRVSIKVIWLLK